jgi:ATP-dependent protease ClpP protease subunit
LLSTPGGNVYDGISIYNFLKGLPIEVSTYNFGSVDSIGVVIFCAGKNRYSAPFARFLLHPISMSITNMVFDEPLMDEKIKSMRLDQLNIARIISFTANKPIEEIKELIHNRATFDPEKALQNGLITEIKSSLIPIGANIISIYDNPIQPRNTVSSYDTFSVPDPQNFSISPEYSTVWNF